MHYRIKCPGEKDDWIYKPTGVGVRLFVIGNLVEAEQVHIFESQWDMLAFMDRTNLYLNQHHAFIATRGSSNTAPLKELIPGDASVLAWPQNDESGRHGLITPRRACPCQ